MIIKYILNKLFGMYPIISDEAKTLALETTAQVILFKLNKLYPELGLDEMDNKQKTLYLKNEYLNEQSKRLLEKNPKAYFKFQDRMEQLIQQILNI